MFSQKSEYQKNQLWISFSSAAGNSFQARQPLLFKCLCWESSADQELYLGLRKTVGGKRNHVFIRFDWYVSAVCIWANHFPSPHLSFHHCNMGIMILSLWDPLKSGNIDRQNISINGSSTIDLNSIIIWLTFITDLLASAINDHANIPDPNPSRY